MGPWVSARTEGDGVALGTWLSKERRKGSPGCRGPPCGMRACGWGWAGLHHGSVSVPDRARDTQTDEIVALKKVRMDKEKDGE